MHILLFALVDLIAGAPVYPRQLSSALSLPFYYPTSIASPPSAQPMMFIEQTNLGLALATLQTEIGASEDDLLLDRDYIDNYGIEHFYFTRTIRGIIVANQNAAVHVKFGIY